MNWALAVFIQIGGVHRLAVARAQLEAVARFDGALRGQAPPQMGHWWPVSAWAMSASNRDREIARVVGAAHNESRLIGPDDEIAARSQGKDRR